MSSLAKVAVDSCVMSRNYKDIEVEEEKKISLYTIKLSEAEADKLETWCKARGWGEY